MAIQNITYGDKTDLNTTSVANINKVSASDLNEIKSVVNNNANELNGVFKGETGRILSNQMTSATIGGSAGKKYVLTFSKTYTSDPTVIATVWNNNAGSYGAVNCAVGKITTTGCELYFMANVSASDIGLEYIVIG